MTADQNSNEQRIGGLRPAESECSPYAAVSSLFERTLPQRLELKHHAFGSKLSRSVFDIDYHHLIRLFEGSVAGRLIGTSFQTFTRQERSEGLTYSELRYCLACLRDGQHSVVFQHALVTHCPLHKVPLQLGCPSCGHRLATDIETLRVSPFCCNNCGHALRRPGHGRHLPALPPRAPFDELRMTLSANDQDATETSRAVFHRENVSRSKSDGCPNQDFVRAAWRHLDWTRSHSLSPLSWQETTHEFVCREQSLATYVVANTVLTTLLRLRDVLNKAGIDSRPPPEKPWVYLQYTRLNSSLTVAATALYRTANLYCMLEPLLRGKQRADFLLEAFGAVPSNRAAAEVIVELEVLGLFARCHAEAAKCNHMGEVDWLNGSEPTTFVPAWRFRADGETAHL